MNQESLDHWLQSANATNLMYEDCGIETLVEDKCWNFLAGRCQLLLRLYSTTKEVRNPYSAPFWKKMIHMIYILPS